MHPSPSIQPAIRLVILQPINAPVATEGCVRMLLLAGDALWRRLLQLGVDVAGNQQGDLVNLEQSIHTAALEILRGSMHPK